MPVEVICTACNKRLRAPDNAVGKKIRCPKCQGLIPVPAAESVNSSAEHWYLQTPDGQQFGPVSRTELDGWLGQGRITAECQLLLEGAPAWQWASEVYPILAPQNSLIDAGGSPSSSSSSSFEFLGGTSPSRSSVSKKSSIHSSDSFVFGTGGEGSIVGDSLITGSFVAPPSSSSRRSTSGRSIVGRSTLGRLSRKKSGVVTAVAVVNYVFGALKLITAFVVFVGGATLATMISNSAGFAKKGPLSHEEAGALGGMVGAAIVLIGVILLISAGLSLAAGYGVMERQQWGRILTLVLGVLSGLSAIASVFALYPGGLISLGYCIFVFVVLLNHDHAAEFM